MDYKRAIEIVKDLDPRGYPTYREAKLMVIEALEKQIPKKPNWEYLGDSFNIITKCPLCDRGIEEGEHHCECGQAIDWKQEV